MSFLQKLNLIIASLFILILGIIIGKYQERILINNENSQIIELTEDINEGIPFIQILGLKDGNLVGTVNDSQIRITTESEVALYNSELNFTLPFNDILRKNLLFNVPKEMNYIASKKGKKFYNIYDSAASKLSSENQIFFQTKQEALAAGYVEN